MKRLSKHSLGLSLVELLIAMAILGILLAHHHANYRSHTQQRFALSAS
jgi:prepilin-type N-terminal cleavage/methylation domain-containing protein